VATKRETIGRQFLPKRTHARKPSRRCSLLQGCDLTRTRPRPFSARAQKTRASCGRRTTGRHGRPPGASFRWTAGRMLDKALGEARISPRGGRLYHHAVKHFRWIQRGKATLAPKAVIRQSRPASMVAGGVSGYSTQSGCLPGATAAQSVLAGLSVSLRNAESFLTTTRRGSFSSPIPSFVDLSAA